jgi:hypothetical protein
LTVARTPKVHELPGLPFPAVPDEAAAADAVPAHLAEYEQRFGLPVHRPVRVRAVRRVDGGYLVETSAGSWRARALVDATGTWSRPFVPHYPGQDTFGGWQLHTVDHRGPEARDRGVLDRLPMFGRITADRVAWDDGRIARADVILWATGFRAAVGQHHRCQPARPGRRAGAPAQPPADGGPPPLRVTGLREGQWRGEHTR